MKKTNGRSQRFMGLRPFGGGGRPAGAHLGLGRWQAGPLGRWMDRPCRSHWIEAGTGAVNGRILLAPSRSRGRRGTATWLDGGNAAAEGGVWRDAGALGGRRRVGLEAQGVPAGRNPAGRGGRGSCGNGGRLLQGSMAFRRQRTNKAKRRSGAET